MHPVRSGQTLYCQPATISHLVIPKWDNSKLGLFSGQFFQNAGLNAQIPSLAIPFAPAKLARRARGLTQEQLAKRLGKPQSFVAKTEGGERRLDVVEFIDLVKAMKIRSTF